MTQPTVSKHEGQ